MYQTIINKLFLLTAVGVALSGCAAIEKSDTMDVERTLVAAGFKMKFADTPEKLASIQAMTQRTVVPHDKNGAVYYAYADAKFCKCIYVGSERAYQEYEKISIQENIAIMNQDAAMDWGVWGGWGPWY